MPTNNSPRLTLGLDIGSASLGWALVDPAAQQVVAAGVRIFKAGVDPLKFERGQPGSSNNADRRTKRLQRRQLRRRAGRQHELLLTLQTAGLLPPSQPASRPRTRGELRNEVISRLDSELRRQLDPELKAAPIPARNHVFPYFLRSLALDRPLPPYAFGRALYSLGQRRGFKSNRLTAASEREQEKQDAADAKSDVKGKINTLRAQIASSGARTLGEYFSRLDPALARIRANRTSREMFEHEFEQVWTAQQPSNPLLTPELKAKIHAILFHQRPIGAGKPGTCELERGQPCAPLALLAAQRFRLLQKVNDLRIGERGLQPGERQFLLDALESEGDITFARLRKLFGLGRTQRFNLEAGGETKLPGNRTAAKLRAIFGARWEAFSPAERERVVRQSLQVADDDHLARIGRDTYGLSPEAAAAWSQLELEDGYSKLSLAAIAKLLPALETGTAYATARKAAYPDTEGQAWGQIPPVQKALPALRNPAVMRSLTEVRKVVNAIVREYGKPWEVRIELARDLKRNAKQRAALAESMRERQKEREKAVAAIRAEVGANFQPRGGDIELAGLYAQSGGICPYCGQQIAFTALFNQSGLAEVDHILPRSRFPDDSFANKCVAHAFCNRDKANRTPYEAFSADATLWPQILARVKQWGDTGKLRAFEATDLDPDNDDSFASRRLNDTRYASVKAADLVASLYGGRVQDGRRVVHTSTGVATATLRRAWLLEKILRTPAQAEEKTSAGKSRDDHRHHAVDAVVIALTTNATIKQLALASAAGAAAAGSERISSRHLQPPWADFVDRIRPAILGINVSHRPEHKLSGGLHNDTNYSKPHANGGRQFVHVRKPVHKLTNEQALQIVDPSVARAVIQKLATVGGDARKLESDPPRLRTRNGHEIPVRRVRIRQASPSPESAVPLRSGYVQPASNHHVEIFAGRDGKRELWIGRTVSTWEACLRKAKGRPVVDRHPGTPDSLFLFSLMAGDMVEMTAKQGGPARPYVLRSISEGDLEFLPHNEAVFQFKRGDEAGARRRSLQRSDGRITNLDGLRHRACRKIFLDPLGRARDAHD